MLASKQTSVRCKAFLNIPPGISELPCDSHVLLVRSCCFCRLELISLVAGGDARGPRAGFRHRLTKGVLAPKKCVSCNKAPGRKISPCCCFDEQMHNLSSGCVLALLL